MNTEICTQLTPWRREEVCPRQGWSQRSEKLKSALSSLLCFLSTRRIKLRFQDSTKHPCGARAWAPCLAHRWDSLGTCVSAFDGENWEGQIRCAPVRKQAPSLQGLSVHHFLTYFILYSLLSLMVDITVSLPMCISTRVVWHHQSSEKDGTYWVIVGKKLFLLCLHCHIIKIRMIPTPQRHCEWIH